MRNSHRLRNHSFKHVLATFGSCSLLCLLQRTQKIIIPSCSWYSCAAQQSLAHTSLLVSGQHHQDRFSAGDQRSYMHLFQVGSSTLYNVSLWVRYLHMLWNISCCRQSHSSPSTVLSSGTVFNRIKLAATNLLLMLRTGFFFFYCVSLRGLTF